MAIAPGIVAKYTVKNLGSRGALNFDRSEGFPRTGYFVPACVGSGRWADFESCSRIHACGFRCFEGKFTFWGVIRKSRHEPIGVRGFLCLLYVFLRFWAVVGEPKRKRECKMLLISHYVLLCCTCFTLMSCYFLIRSKCWTSVFWLGFRRCF